MFIPYSCDARLYHLPFGTAGLIAANVLVFVGHATGVLSPDNWFLEYANGLHPAQWLLCNFTHLGVVHLVGNMVFLWVFGFVVEGKIGLARFLSVYLVIGAGHGFAQQLIMLNYDGLSSGSAGASAAIYGLMAMACVWAPVNNLQVACFIWYIPIMMDVSVSMFAAFYIGLDLLFAVFLGADSSQWLHILGAAIGAPLAIVMLNKGVVDCEGWDLFCVLRGEYGADAIEKKRQQADSPQQQADRFKRKRTEETRRFDAYLEIGQPLQALAVRRRMHDVDCPLQLTQTQLYRLIVELHKQKQWAESAPLMAEYTAAFEQNVEPMKVKLAQICLQALERPHKAVEVLQSVDQSQLAPPQLAQLKKIAAVARQQIAGGALELDNAPW